MPSSSARCAQFPRAQDKVHFYIKLRELRDQLKGVRQNTEIQEVAYSFDLQQAKGELILTVKSEAGRRRCDWKRAVKACLYFHRGRQEDGH